MPPSPAREIKSVTPPFVTILSPTGLEELISITDLPMTEVRKAIAMYFPDAGIHWLQSGLTKEEMVNAMLTNTLPNVTTREVREPVTVPAVPTSTFTPDPIPATPATSNGNGDAKALADLIRRLAGSSVDADQVRSIVTAELSTITDSLIELIESETAKLRPHVTEIHVGSNDEFVTIEGRQHYRFDAVVRCLASDNPITGPLNLALVGPPGTGKTYMAHKAAQALSLDFASISCSPTMPDSRLQGFIDANGIYRDTNFRRIFEHGGVFLFDEMDNSHPGILAACNQALANDYCAFPDGMVKRHATTSFVCAMNTFGTGATRQFVGRNALDAATLDRFVYLTIPIDQDIETDITTAISPTHAASWLEIVRSARAKVESHKLEVIISPRASYYGASLLNSGFTISEVTEMVIAKGMSDDVRAKVL